ncbi:hypothetical protein LPW26_20345 [Rhodopseudomonas sp. HC1]|nr:hypothetical protein [Rhodopseudomonas infernalis]
MIGLQAPHKRLQSLKNSACAVIRRDCEDLVMSRSSGHEAGFVPRTTPFGSLRLMRAVAASLAAAVVVLGVMLLLAVVSTQSSMAMPFAI